MKIKRRVGKPPRIEMLPLIDAVFLLLVFFIYAMMSMSVQHGLQLQMPVSSQADTSVPGAIGVSLRGGEKGLQLYVNKDEVSLADLGRQLRQQIGHGSQQPVLVYGEAGVSYQQLFTVLDELKKNGIEKVSLQVSRE